MNSMELNEYATTKSINKDPLGWGGGVGGCARAWPIQWLWVLAHCVVISVLFMPNGDSNIFLSQSYGLEHIFLMFFTSVLDHAKMTLVQGLIILAE